MKILEYYKNLRKRRIVIVAALALVALVLVVTPLTTHAGTGVTSTDKDGVLYLGESVTLTHDFLPTDLLSIGERCVFFIRFNGFGHYMNKDYTVAGVKLEYVSDNEIRITNMSCAADKDMIINLSVLAVGRWSEKDAYSVRLNVSPQEPPKSAFGDLFENLDIFLSSMLTFMQQFLTFMTANPILLIPLIVFLVGVAIFFLVRLIKD